MNVERLVEWQTVEETEVLGENNPYQWHLFRHKSHMPWSGMETGQSSLRSGKPVTNSLSCSTAQLTYRTIRGIELLYGIFNDMFYI
jgi:hypothetical protein